jgi:hypothetical protein
VFREKAVLPTGGYVLVTYRPIFVLVDFLKMGEFYLPLLILGFSLLVYLVVSAVVAIASKLLKKKDK